MSQHEIKEEEEEGGDASDDADETYVDVEGEEEEDDTLEADDADEVDPDEAEFERRSASTPKSGRLSRPLVRHSF